MSSITVFGSRLSGGGSTDSSNPPTGLSYLPSQAVAKQGFPIIPLIPTVGGGSVDSWGTTAPLPAGISIGPTGIVFGSFTGAPFGPTTVTVVATNEDGAATADIVLENLAIVAPSNLVYPAPPASLTVGLDQLSLTPAVDGDPVDSWTISGEPTGVTIDQLSGTLQGIPADEGSFSILVTATNVGGFTTDTVVIAVVAAGQPPVSIDYPEDPAQFFFGVAKTLTPSLVGGAPDLWSISPTLPAGLTFNTSNGEVSGSAAARISVTPFTVTASNAFGSAQTTLQLLVVDAAPTSLTYLDESPTYIVGTPITTNTPTVVGTGTFLFEVSPSSTSALPGGVSLNPGSGFITGTPTSEFTAADVIIRASNSEGAVEATINFTVAGVAPSALVYDTNPVTAIVNQAITLTPSNAGGTITAYNVDIALPDGLLLNTATGLIDGTPTGVVLSATYRVTGTNASGSAFVDLVLEVNDEAPASFNYTDSPVTLVNGQAEAGFNPSSVGSGGTIDSYTSADLPPGLDVALATGVISGTPTTTDVVGGVSTIVGTNETGTTQASFEWVVNPAAPTSITYDGDNVLNLVVGQPVLEVPVVGGGNELLLFTDVDDLASAGIPIDTLTGTISGIPLAVLGTQNFTVRVENITGSVDQEVILTVADAAPTNLVYSPNPAVYEVGSGFVSVLASNGGGAVDSYSDVGGTPLPSGIVLNTTSGTLVVDTSLAIASATYVIRGTNETGFVDSSVTIEVALTLPATPSNLVYPEGPHMLEVSTPMSPLVPTVVGQVDSYSVAPDLPNQALPALTLPTITAKVSPVAADETGVSYTPPEKTVAATALIGESETLSIFYPTGTEPVEGWPSALIFRGAAYFGLPALTSLDAGTPLQASLIELLDRGIAVLVFSMASSGGGTGQHYVPPNDPGGEWEDWNYSTHMKSSLMGVQWYQNQSTYPLDRKRFLVGGESSTSIAAVYSVLSSDRGFFPSAITNGQIQQPTACSGVFMFDPFTSNNAMLGAFTTGANNWESQATPGADATSYADADQGFLRKASVHDLLLDSPGYAHRTPAFIVCDEALGSTDFTLDPDGFPALRNTLGANVHDLWHGASLATRLELIQGPLWASKGEFWVGGGHEASLPAAQAALVTGTFASGDKWAATQTALGDWCEARLTEASDLPSGMQIERHTGIVFGRPTTIDPLDTYTFTATNLSGSTTGDTQIEVTDGAPLSVDYSFGLSVELEIGVAFSYPATVLGGVPDTWEILPNPLLGPPPGVGFDFSDGRIFGTPTAIWGENGDGAVGVRATNAFGFAERFFQARVYPEPPSALDYNSGVWSIEEGTAVSLLPTFGGSPDTFALVSGTLPPGITLDTSTGELAGTATATQASADVDITASNGVTVVSETISITVTHRDLAGATFTYDPAGTPEGTYSFTVDQEITPLDATVTGALVDTFSIQSGTLPNGLTLNAVTGQVTGQPDTVAVQASITVRAANALPSVLDKVILITIEDTAPIDFLYPGEATGGPRELRFTRGLAIVGEVPAIISGGEATSWSITDESFLNANGVTFNEADGSFTGTSIFNSVAGGVFTITATNSLGSVSFPYTVKVYPPEPTSIDYGGDLTPVVGQPFTVTPTTDAQLATWSSDPLPAGLSIDTVNGSISGTATAVPAGNPVTVSVFVANVSGFAQAQVVINVTSTAPTSYTLDPDRLPASQVTPYRYDLTIGELVTPITPTVDALITSYSVDPALPNSTTSVGFGSVTAQPGTILPTNGSPLDFAPVEFTGTVDPLETANVFMPQGTPPAGGWPWVISSTMFGYNGRAALSSLDATVTGSVEHILHDLVNKGFAVVCVGFGASGTSARGVWRDPTQPEWASSDTYSFQEKSARWAIQRAKSEWASSFGFNADRGGVVAGNQSTHVFAASCLGADRAELTGSDQEQTSTRMAFCVAVREPSVWLEAYQDAVVITDVTHFAHSGTGFPNAALSFATADTAELESNSLVTFLSEPESMAADTAVMGVYDTVSSTTNFTLSANLPVLNDTLNPLVDGVDLWNGGMLATILLLIDGPFHAANSELWVLEGSQPSMPLTQQGYVSGTFTGSALQSTEVLDAIGVFALKHGDADAPNPGGLVLNEVTGLISGAPDTLQAITTHTLTATGPGGFIERDIQLEVVLAPVNAGSGLDADDTVSMSLADHAPDLISTGVQYANRFLKGDLWIESDGSGNLSPLLRGDGVMGHGFPDPTQSAGARITISGSRRKGYLPNGPWRLRWKGDGQVSLTHGGSDFVPTSSGTDPDGFSFIEYDVAADQNNLALTVNIDSFGVNAQEDPIRDVQVFDPNHDENSGLLASEYASFMNDHNAGAGTDGIRYFQSLKGIRYSVNDDRAAGGQPADPRGVGLEDFTQRSKPGQNQGSWFGVCAEYICTEANELLAGTQHAKCFITVKPPIDGQDESVWIAYMTAWADLYLNGSTVDGVVWPGLDPSVNLQIELGDELWNPAIRAGYGYYNRLEQSTGTPRGQLIAADVVKMRDAFLAAGWPANRLDVYIGGDFVDPGFTQAILNALPAGFDVSAYGPATYFKPKSSKTGSGPGGYLEDFPNNLPTTDSFLDDVRTELNNTAPNGYSGALTRWVNSVSYTNSDGSSPSLEAYEGGVNLQPSGPNEIDFPETNPDGWYVEALDANVHPEIFELYVEWFNLLASAGFRRVYHFSSAKAWLDTLADDASWGNVQHFDAEVLTIEPNRKARFIGPLEVKELDFTGFSDLPRKRFTTLPDLVSRGEPEIPAVSAPRGAPQWRVYPQQGRYENVASGANFTGVGNFAHVVCARNANPGDAIEIVEPVTQPTPGAGAGTEWGGGDAGKGYVASWEGTANAGLPMNLDIYGVDRDTIVIPTIKPQRYNQSNVEQGGCAGLRFWNVTVQCWEFQRYAVEFGGIDGTRTDTEREMDAPQFLGCNFVGEGNADQEGYGIFAGIRAFSVHPKNLRVSGCMFGALSDGVSQLPFTWDGVTPNQDILGIGEHCIYVDTPRGDLIIEDISMTPGIQQEYFNPGTGQFESRGSLSRSAVQVVQRSQIIGTPGTGRIIIDNFRAQNRWGNGAAAFSFWGYHGEIHLRRCSDTAGWANENENQVYRTLLTDPDPDKGAILNSNGFTTTRLVVTDLVADHGSVSNISGSVAGISSCESTEIYGFDFRGANAGGRAWQFEDAQQNGDPVNFPNGDVKFYLQNRGSLVSANPGFGIRSVLNKIRLQNNDLGDAVIDSTYPNLR